MSSSLQSNETWTDRFSADDNKNNDDDNQDGEESSSSSSSGSSSMEDSYSFSSKEDDDYPYSTHDGHDSSIESESQSQSQPRHHNHNNNNNTKNRDNFTSGEMMESGMNTATTTINSNAATAVRRSRRHTMDHVATSHLSSLGSNSNVNDNQNDNQNGNIDTNYYRHSNSNSKSTRRHNSKDHYHNPQSQSQSQQHQSDLAQFTIRQRKRSTTPPPQSSPSQHKRKAKAKTSPLSRHYSSRRNRPSSHESSSSSSSSSHHKIRVPSIASLYMTSLQTIFSKKSSILFLFSILIWLYVQFHYATGVHSQSYASSSLTKKQKGGNGNNNNSNYSRDAIDLSKKISKLRKKREQSAMQALGSAAGEYFFKRKDKPSTDGYSPTEDRMPNGCSRQEWQRENHPICNDVHLLDLRNVYFKRNHRSGHGQGNGNGKGNGIENMDVDVDGSSNSTNNGNGNAKKEEEGYVGSGMWRQVWKIIPSNGDLAVLKMMKNEHPVSPRNFDRHRRDALAMEMLTDSKRIVDIYAFCGNTVLTEYAGMTLDEFLYDGGYRREGYSRRYDLKRGDGMGKVDLALDVMQGLEDMHEHDILHADIQAKQFLLDPVGGVKLNDFNRCRFLPTDDQTGEVCGLKIPSAPGAQRSPEEYELQRLGTKADVFSAANILFGILTGEKPWGKEFMRKDIRKNIVKGYKPEVGERFLEPGTVDSELANIVYKAYEYDPKKRWSATQIIRELEYIRDRKQR